jgi:hypothetical protein
MKLSIPFINKEQQIFQQETKKNLPAPMANPDVFSMSLAIPIGLFQQDFHTH